jgi:anti-anti-sigma factor
MADMSTSKHEPALVLTLEEHSNAIIVHCKGKLVAGHTALLHDPVAALIPHHKRIILDLRELTHMDSMGIGAMLRLYVHAKTHHSSIECRNLGERIKELMIMTNLMPVFTAMGEHGTRVF